MPDPSTTRPISSPPLGNVEQSALGQNPRFHPTPAERDDLGVESAAMCWEFRSATACEWSSVGR